MESIIARESSPVGPTQSCQVGLMTSTNYKAVQFSSVRRATENFKEGTIADEPYLQVTHVSCNGKNICFIDENRNLWLAVYEENLQNQPVNLSAALGKKVNEVFVGQDEIIIKCDKSDYLIYLKESFVRELPPFVLQKVMFRKPSTIAAKYTIYELEGQFGKYFLSYNQKTQKVELNMAYDQKTIRNLQTGEQFLCQNQILGASFSKYHTICWDSKGGVYSWGLRSSWVVETSELIMQPKKVSSLNDEFIFCGVADEYYCLAINREGELIQWGIKNRTQIYPYQRIRTRTGLERMIAVKGCDKMYASMGMSGKLYLWGQNSQGLLLGVPGSRQCPTPCKKLQNKRLSDFDFTREYVVVIASGASELMRRFKLLQLNGIRTNYKKLLKSRRLFASTLNLQSQSLSHKPRLKTEMENEQLITGPFEDEHTDQRLITYIDSKPKHTKRLFTPATTHFNKLIEYNKSTLNELKERGDVLFDRINLKLTSIQTSAQSARSEINNAMKANPNKGKVLKPSRSRENNTHSSCENMRRTAPYEMRLKLVTQRRNRIDTQHLHTLTQSTLQNRRLKKEIALKEKRLQIMKMIMGVMMRDWVVRAMTKPIVGAKLVMVEQYRNSLAFQMKVKRLQTSFFRRYIARRIQNLSPYNKYMLLRFLARTKAKLRKRRQKKLADSLLTYSTISSMKRQISHMILLFTYTIKKYQKIARWYKEVKVKKILALRIKWNLNLINGNIIRFKQSNMFSEFRNQEFDQLEVSDIYENFVKQRPCLRLTRFAQMHPIFRINFNMTKKINIRQIDAPKIQRSHKSKKGGIVTRVMKRSKISKIISGKKTESQDNQFQRLKIMPYSVDHQELIFSRKYSLKVPENVLKSPRWVEFQSTLLQKLLQYHVRINQKKYILELQRYDKLMADFIQHHYQIIYQRRARYLLIPALIPASICSKLRRQLDRMTKRGQKSSLLKDHFMQDRHIILEIALKLQGCPVKPMLRYGLDKSVFKELFLIYVQKLSKGLRMVNVKNVGKLQEILKFD